MAAGTAANIPVAVDFGNFNPGRPFEELVTKHLRPGDWYTHMYTQRVPYFDANGKLRPYLHEARNVGSGADVAVLRVDEGKFGSSTRAARVRTARRPRARAHAAERRRRVGPERAGR